MDLHSSTVTVDVPARAEFAHVLRTVVASAAARWDLTVDAIEDLRITVDEACTQLLAVGGRTLHLQAAPAGDGVEVIVSIDAEGGDWPPDGMQRSLAWQVLRGLSDEIAWERHEGDPAIRIHKRAVGTAAS